MNIRTGSPVPFFSVVVPLYNTPQPLLGEMIASVQAQSSEDWELVLVDDASPDGTTASRAAALAADDPRIRITALELNRGIAEATNVGLGLARGEFIALLDHDDLLAPDALQAVRAAIETGTDVDYVYTDEDKIDEEGQLYDTFLKPAWSPERLLGQMYTSHLSVFRRSLLEDMAAFDTKYNGSQDHELVLRITERARAIAHVPRPLYHWRAVDGSTAKSGSEKSYAWDAGVLAVADTLLRRGIRGAAMRGPAAGIYYVRREPVDARSVTIVISVPDSDDRLDALLADIRRTSYGRHSPIALVVSAHRHEAHTAQVRALRRRTKTVLVPDDASALERLQAGVTAAATPLVVLIDGRAALGDKNVVKELLMPLTEPDVVMTGGRLLDPLGKTILHAGYRYARSMARHPYRGSPKETLGRIGALLVNREVSAVCAALSAVRRDAFLAVGGFSPALSGAAAEIDLGAKLRAEGGRVITVSRAEAVIDGLSASDDAIEDDEFAVLVDRWGKPGRDPYTP